MAKADWYILIVYADEAWRRRVTGALAGQPVRTVTVSRCMDRPIVGRPAPHAVVMQASVSGPGVRPVMIERIRDRMPSSRLVAVIATGRGEAVQAMRDAGADDAFAEPIEPAAFTLRVRRSLLDLSIVAPPPLYDLGPNADTHPGAAGSSVRFRGGTATPGAPSGAGAAPSASSRRKVQYIRDRLRQAYVDSTMALVAAAEAKEKFARRHSINVASFARGIGRRLNLPEKLVQQIETAAVLHDVGKIGIPDAILTKPGRLTEAEFEIIKQHPRIAMDILGHVSFLEAELPMILHHHERFDGSGYPDGLAGEEIPLGARIIAVADSVEVMLSRRAYKRPYDGERVRDELHRQSGRQFDPTVAAAAIDWMHEPLTARILQTKSASADSVIRDAHRDTRPARTDATQPARDPRVV